MKYARSHDGHQNSKLQISGFHSIGNIIRSVIKQNEMDRITMEFMGRAADWRTPQGYQSNRG